MNPHARTFPPGATSLFLGRNKTVAGFVARSPGGIFCHPERSEESRETIAGGRPDGCFALLLIIALVCHPERSEGSIGMLLAGNTPLDPSLRSG